jgi:2-succinyl-6-hydroxy-2,4-cyclohexadiene-1-carboxylate synthase
MVCHGIESAPTNFKVECSQKPAIPVKVIQFSKESDERREAGPLECWCLHGAVGTAADWRGLAKHLATTGIGTRAVDLWRFLECCPLSLPDFGKALNADASGQVFRGSGRALLGYSMGGRMALHSLLENRHPWQAAVIVSADPGLENEAHRAERRGRDTEWATQALTGNWQQFLETWNAQAVLGNAAMRDPAASSSLMQRRREVARSFVDWSLGSQDPLWDRLGEISCPVLWVVGENDAKFRGLAERAVSLMPNAHLAIAPNTGHRVPWESETWFVGQVSEFLKLGHV